MLLFLFAMYMLCGTTVNYIIIICVAVNGFCKNKIIVIIIYYNYSDIMYRGKKPIFRHHARAAVVQYNILIYLIAVQKNK